MVKRLVERRYAASPLKLCPAGHAPQDGTPYAAFNSEDQRRCWSIRCEVESCPWIASGASAEEVIERWNTRAPLNLDAPPPSYRGHELHVEVDEEFGEKLVNVVWPSAVCELVRIPCASEAAAGALIAAIQQYAVDDFEGELY